MARRRRIKRLGVWLDGQHVADLEQDRWPKIRCRYTQKALLAWPANTPLISCSLPLQEDSQDALAFCKGLLPEGQALQTMAADAGIAVNETLGLLARYGRDVAGALVISEEAPEPRRFDVEPYSPDGLATAVTELEDHPLGVHDDSELSLAGLQDKLLLVRLSDEQWGRPIRGRPSTHILKIGKLGFDGLIGAEADALRLAHAVGLTSIEIQVEEIGGIDCLIVSRFDRRSSGGGVERIHQEDLCQAVGIDPDHAKGRAKYESNGGPRLLDMARLLDAYAADPQADLRRLVQVVAFTVVINNADAHGKNLALLHPDAESVTLAPLYDTVPTALWPKLRKESAMMIGGRVVLAETTLDDIVREATGWDYPETEAREVATATIEALAAAADDGTIHAESRTAEFVRTRAEQRPGQ